MPLPEIVGQQPMVKRIDQLSQAELPEQYLRLLIENPLLARMEKTCRDMRWSDEEIRTAQLLAACISNAELKARVLQLEGHIKASMTIKV